MSELQRNNVKEANILATNAAIQVLKKGVGDGLLGPSDNSLIILTHSAQITAEQYGPSENSSAEELIADSFIENILKVTESHVGPDKDSPKPIYLKNVRLVPFSAPETTFTYAFLTVFTDQIVAVTFGSPL